MEPGPVQGAEQSGAGREERQRKDECYTIGPRQQGGIVR